jgi:hypothetical protein
MAGLLFKKIITNFKSKNQKKVTANSERQFITTHFQPGIKRIHNHKFHFKSFGLCFENAL